MHYFICSYSHPQQELYEKCKCDEIRIRLSSYQQKLTSGLLLYPTWYRWKWTDKFIKISAHLIPSLKIPKFDDFLPYTQWPPMILQTEKTRLDLMIEEEQAGQSIKSLFSLYQKSQFYRLLRQIPFKNFKSPDYIWSLTASRNPVKPFKPY